MGQNVSVKFWSCHNLVFSLCKMETKTQKVAYQLTYGNYLASYNGYLILGQWFENKTNTMDYL